MPSDGRNPAEGDPYPPERVYESPKPSDDVDPSIRRDWGAQGPATARDTGTAGSRGSTGAGAGNRRDLDRSAGRPPDEEGGP